MAPVLIRWTTLPTLPLSGEEQIALPTTSVKHLPFEGEAGRGCSCCYATLWVSITVFSLR